MYIGAAIVEDGREVSTKKLELSYNPAILLLGIYIWKRGKLYVPQGTQSTPCTPVFTAVLWIAKAQKHNLSFRQQMDG